MNAWMSGLFRVIYLTGEQLSINEHQKEMLLATSQGGKHVGSYDLSKKPPLLTRKSPAVAKRKYSLTRCGTMLGSRWRKTSEPRLYRRDYQTEEATLQ